MPNVFVKGMGRVFFPDSMSESDIAGTLAARSQELLDMTTAARMQRAKEQGFDIDKSFFHGSKDDIPAFELGNAPEGRADAIFLSQDPEFANAFAGNVAGLTPGGNVTQVRTSLKNPMEVPLRAGEYANPQIEVMMTNEAKRLGHDGIIFTSPGKEPIHVVFDPSDIRSVNAAFDPARKGSRDLLAGAGAGLATVAGSLFTPETSKAFADQGFSHLIPTGDTIDPDEFPRLERAADFIDKYSQTPFGPAFEGISRYLRGFGEDVSSKEKAKRAMIAALDLL